MSHNFYNYKVTTPPVTEPVSLDEAKDHSNILHDLDDAILFGFIQAARYWCEKFTQRSFIDKSYTMKIDNCFPANEIIIPVAPLKSLTTFTYVDEDEVVQTVSSSLYILDTFSTPPRIKLDPDEDWPSSVREQINTISIEFIAGYGDATDVPVDIKHAILMLVDHYYEHRSDVSELSLIPTPKAVESLLYSYRVKLV